jgi:hypothetical protein
MAYVALAASFMLLEVKLEIINRMSLVIQLDRDAYETSHGS